MRELIKAFTFKYLLKELRQFNTGDTAVFFIMTVKTAWRENLK